MRNRSNILVGAPDVKSAGGVLIGSAAPDEANYPSDASAKLPEALKVAPAGYISEDGVTKTVDRSTEKIKDWNGDTVIITQSDHSVTLKLTFLEAANAEVLKVIAGDDNVAVKGNSVTVIDTADELPHRSFVFEIHGGEGKHIRVFAPDAQATEVGDVSYVRSDVVKYEVTLECFPDAEGKKLIQFIDRPADDPAPTGSESGTGDEAA